MVGMSLEGTDQIALDRVEDLHQTVGGGTGKVLPIGREVQTEDRVAMGIGQVSDELALGHVPDLYFTISGGLPAAGGQQPAIRAEGQGADPTDQLVGVVYAADRVLQRPARIGIPKHRLVFV